MADFTDVIDLPSLLAPLAGEAPQGRDTRREFDAASPYQRLRTARQDARDAERRALTAGPDEPAAAADWGAVAAAAADLIGAHSKDMEAAAWMLEALTRTHGLRGIGAGARLIAGLADAFGEVLFPLAEEDDPDDDPAEARIRPIAGLASGPRASLLAPIRLLPLFARPDGSVVTLADYDAAVAIERLDPEQKERRIADGAVSIAAIDDQARRDPDAIARLARDAAEALGAWAEMDAALGRLAGRAKPNLADVGALLERIDGFARRLAPAGAPAGETAPAPDAPPAQAGPAPAAPAGGGAIATREDALRRLDEVAAWFRRHEPQSPLSYTLAEAVRRGRMSLPDLLAEVVADPATRAQILIALGIKPPAEADEQ